MLTADERLTRLDAFVRRAAQRVKSREEAADRYVALRVEAAEIVANSPAPVDPLLLKARQIAQRNSRNDLKYCDGGYDDSPLVQCALEALRSAQEPQA